MRPRLQDTLAREHPRQVRRHEPVAVRNRHTDSALQIDQLRPEQQVAEQGYVSSEPAAAARELALEQPVASKDALARLGRNHLAWMNLCFQLAELGAVDAH